MGISTYNCISLAYTFDLSKVLEYMQVEFIILKILINLTNQSNFWLLVSNI